MWDSIIISVVQSNVLDTDRNVEACAGEGAAVLTASTGTITSPGYESGGYSNNASCQWVIRAPLEQVRMIL